jgi:hypothetical protein
VLCCLPAAGDLHPTKITRLVGYLGRQCYQGKRCYQGRNASMATTRKNSAR